MEHMEAVRRRLFTICPCGWAPSAFFAAEAVFQLIGGTVCILTMYFTVYRPMRGQADHLPEERL